MAILRTRPVAAIAGALSWTALEYGLHRCAMHQMRGRGLASAEHLEHHADVAYFSPAAAKLASATATTAVVYPMVARAAGRRWAASFTAGLIMMYSSYEVAHRRTHTHPPRNRYARWARRNHMQHHFHAPMQNFGVTTPVWDRLFGTSAAPGIVTVPRRMAPVWLLDEAGEVRAEYAADYVVKGDVRAEASRTERDRTDAFANLAPEV